MAARFHNDETLKTFLRIVRVQFIGNSDFKKDATFDDGRRVSSGSFGRAAGGRW
jgi:hypothetical protein